MRFLEKLSNFLHRYRSGGYADGGLIPSRASDRNLSVDEASRMLEEWREAFGSNLLDSFEREIILPTRSHGAHTAKDVRHIENFVQHALKELPSGCTCRIRWRHRAVRVVYPMRSGETFTRNWDVSFDFIEDHGIVFVLNMLKSITGEYLGDTSQKPQLAKSLRQNSVLPPTRRLRLGRAKNAASGES